MADYCVRTSGSIQAWRTPRRGQHHGPISQLLRRGELQDMSEQSHIHTHTHIHIHTCECKWESAVHVNLPSTTSLPIALPHVCMSNTLRPRWCIESHNVVLLRKAGRKWIGRYQMYFSICRLHCAVLSSWLQHPALSDMEADHKYCLWYFSICG